MNYKLKIYLSICGSLFALFCFYMYFCKQPIKQVMYVDYLDEKHQGGVDELMVKNQFWLFHGEFDQGKREIFKNIISQERVQDFDETKTTKYYTKVALFDNKVVGFITYYIFDFFDESKKKYYKIGRIHLLSVDTNYRRLGIGSDLVAAVIAFFKLEQCNKVYLATRPENVRAKTLYYKFGFFEQGNTDFIDAFCDNNPADYLFKDL